MKGKEAVAYIISMVESFLKIKYSTVFSENNLKSSIIKEPHGAQIDISYLARKDYGRPGLNRIMLIELDFSEKGLAKVVKIRMNVDTNKLIPGCCESLKKILSLSGLYTG